MPSRSDVLLSNLEELQQDLLDLWRTLTRDPAKEARKERAWTILAGVFLRWVDPTPRGRRLANEARAEAAIPAA